MSLPRPVRLTRRRDYEAVRTQGFSRGGRVLALGVLAGTGDPKVKAGLIVPKALGSAPVRNQIKRRLREIVRQSLDTLPAHHAIVTIARRGAVGADFATLRREWRRLARQAGVLPRTAAVEIAPPCPAP